MLVLVISTLSRDALEPSVHCIGLRTFSFPDCFDTGLQVMAILVTHTLPCHPVFEKLDLLRRLHSSVFNFPCYSPLHVDSIIVSETTWS